MDHSVDTLADLVRRMGEIRTKHGDEAWRRAMTQLGKDCLREGGQMEQFASVLFAGLQDQGLDWDQLKQEYEAEKAAQQGPDMAMFMRALQQQLPGIKSQAQFTAFQASFEAFRAVVNGVLEGNREAEAAGKEALAKSFETLRVATDLTGKLQDVPEAATSKEAEAFKRPPSEFGEYDIQRGLLSELQQIQTLSELNEWWAGNRARIDEVKSPALRNPLIDLVREKKGRLSQGGQA